MYKSVLSKLVTGEKVQTIVRIKPNDRSSIEDIKVLGQAISLFDNNSRCKKLNFPIVNIFK